VLSRIGLAILVFFLSASAQAADSKDTWDVAFRKDSVMVFGGVFSSGNMSQAAVPFSRSENNYMVGAVLHRHIADLPWYFVFGAEVGVAGRFGEREAVEAFTALNLRFWGLRFGNWVTIAPGLSAGFSVVSDTLGVERQREIVRGGNATLLFYLQPEISLMFHQWPGTELVLRLHHRSGAYGTLGKMHDGANVHTIGLRWRR
jgi:hypothetical protein